MEVVFSRGDVLQVNLDPTVGIKKHRPCVVVQNNVGNKHSPITIIIPITDKRHVKKLYPVNVLVAKGEGGLTKDGPA